MRSPIISKYIYITLGAIFLVTGVVVISFAQKEDQSVHVAEEVQPGYLIDKVVRYSFTVQNTTDKPLKGAEFRAYAPVKQTAHQKTEKIKASSKYDLEVDELGNQIMEFHIPFLAPHASKVITVTAKLKMSSEPNKFAEKQNPNEMFLEAEQNLEAQDKQIKKLAKQLKTDGASSTAKSIYDWINKNINYAGYIKEDRGALYALENKKGDCTEYAYLFSALARANKIPSRVLSGYVYKTNAVVDPADFHNWSEYLSDSKWHLIDPQGNKFEEDQENYIAMRIISSKNTSKMGGSHRFITTSNGLRVKINKA